MAVVATEAFAELRSMESYWDSDDDSDGGPKPSDLYGNYTWKIDKFSQISRRELRSHQFDVGGYKWNILIYPQGCVDAGNCLSLFLCVANHDKLLPGWSPFAQFSITMVNKDPKKSKSSDTLHRFWNKQHDWGWKKFMELEKVMDGFLDADTLTIKVHVQVIREREDQPFRCLDSQYRRELVRLYLTQVVRICKDFEEQRRATHEKLIEDKARWSSMCAFWLGLDQRSMLRMSREETKSILKAVVKHFFKEKEVVSTLVMDSLYVGLKAIECQNKRKKMIEEVLPIPIVRIEKDIFVLADDALLLLERAATEPFTEVWTIGAELKEELEEELNPDCIERVERLLIEIGRRTMEIFVLNHIFSKIKAAYEEDAALKKQEELIREEEAARPAKLKQKSKRRAH